MIQKVKTFYNKYYKQIIFILILLPILFLFFIFRNKKDKTDTGTDAVKTTSNPTINDSEPLLNDNQAYYSNQIITNSTPVTGFSWKGDKNIYSTEKGIYDAGTNKVILETSIDNIKWADNFNAILFSNNSWHFFDYDNNNIIKIPLTLINPIISNDNKYILDSNNNILKKYKIADLSEKSLVLEEQINKIMIGRQSQLIIVQTTYAGNSYYYQLDEDLNILKNMEIKGNYQLSSVSPNGEIVAAISNNNLIIHDLKEIKTNKEFTERSQITTGFSSNARLIVFEKYKDKLSRTLDNIHSINTLSEVVKISDSKPIPGRIDFSIPMMFNQSGYIVSFKETNGKTWILSLRPNLYPTYSEAGELVLSILKPESH